MVRSPSHTRCSLRPRALRADNVLVVIYRSLLIFFFFFNEFFTVVPLVCFLFFSLFQSLQHSPFLCNLLYAFQTPEELMLLMPFMQGGDLRYHLREHGPLAEPHVKFYAAELLCAMVTHNTHRTRNRTNGM